MHKEIRCFPQNLVVSETLLCCGKCGSRMVIKLYISIIFFRVSLLSPLIFFITLELAEPIRKAGQIKLVSQIQTYSGFLAQFCFLQTTKFLQLRVLTLCTT